MNDPRHKDFDERHTKLPTVTALTKREYLATMAMQGLLTKEGWSERIMEEVSDKKTLCDYVAAASVKMADALLKQLSNP